MDSLVEKTKLKVRGWTDAHKHVVIYDEAASVLLDVVSGRGVKISWRSLKAFEEKIHPETQDRYLVLLFENGSQIALVDPGGIAFAPATKNSGLVGGLPPVMCFGDFNYLKQRIEHQLYNHLDEPPPRECLDMIMICIATLDGARAVGFEVDDMERELEKLLGEVERRIG